MSMTMELKCCPFCGKQPVTFGSGDGQRGLMIECMTDGCVNPHVSYYDHAVAQKVWNTRATASLQGEDAVERVELPLARAINDVLNAMVDAREEMTTTKISARILGDDTVRAILATGLVPDEAAVRANNTANLISIIADIREKTGLGGKPMLNELADAIVAEMDRRVADEREKCAKVADKHASSYDNEWNRKLGKANDLVEACEEIAAAIRSGGGE
jgi:hypothetical protein